MAVLNKTRLVVIICMPWGLVMIDEGVSEIRSGPVHSIQSCARGVAIGCWSQKQAHIMKCMF